MSIEQFEISLGSRIAQVPARQNLKAMQYQEARRAALEASKAKAKPKPKTEPMQDDVPAQDDAGNDGFDASDFND